MMNHYGVLGVGPEASDEALRTAYRRRARETHPDHGGTRTRFAEVRAAWDVLRQPSQRAAYDRELRAFLGSIGAVLCPFCGAANRVPPRRPAAATCATRTCRSDRARPATASSRSRGAFERGHWPSATKPASGSRSRRPLGRGLGRPAPRWRR